MSTRYRVALLGHGIGSSLSPALHMTEARRLGLDYEYRIVDLVDRTAADLGVELRRLEDAGFHAANVTHPYKQAVLEHVDRLSPTVQRLGSANLVIFDDLDDLDDHGGRTAHNTDRSGFRAALERFLDGRAMSGAQSGAQSGTQSGTVLQVGAGGAGLATAAGLVDLGFGRVVVHDVAPAAVAALLARLAPSAGGRLLGSGGTVDAWLPRVDGVVHVTPVGMAAHPGVAFDVGGLAAGAWVAEVVYRPLETELVRRARAAGHPTLDGGAMAVGQAADSLRLITGLEPDAARMHAHFTRLVAG